MSRKLELELAKIAGYHNDTKTFVRLLCTSRVSREKMDNAWAIGVQAKQNAIKCSCRECKA